MARQQLPQDHLDKPRSATFLWQSIRQPDDFQTSLGIMTYHLLTFQMVGRRKPALESHFTGAFFDRCISLFVVIIYQLCHHMVIAVEHKMHCWAWRRIDDDLIVSSDFLTIICAYVMCLEGGLVCTYCKIFYPLALTLVNPLKAFFSIPHPNRESSNPHNIQRLNYCLKTKYRGS